jgi:hypothetical protein
LTRVWLSEVVAIEVCFDVSAIDGVSVDKGVVDTVVVVVVVGEYLRVSSRKRFTPSRSDVSSTRAQLDRYRAQPNAVVVKLAGG